MHHRFASAAPTPKIDGEDDERLLKKHFLGALVLTEPTEAEADMNRRVLKRKKAQNQPLVIVNEPKPLDGNFQRISTSPNVHQKLPGRRVWVCGRCVGTVQGRTAFGKMLTLKRMAVHGAQLISKNLSLHER